MNFSPTQPRIAKGHRDCAKVFASEDKTIGVKVIPPRTDPGARYCMVLWQWKVGVPHANPAATQGWYFPNLPLEYCKPRRVSYRGRTVAPAAG